MDKRQHMYAAFMEGVCDKLNCKDALPFLLKGFNAFCESNNVAPSFAAKFAIWKNQADRIARDLNKRVWDVVSCGRYKRIADINIDYDTTHDTEKYPAELNDESAFPVYRVFIRVGITGLKIDDVTVGVHVSNDGGYLTLSLGNVHYSESGGAIGTDYNYKWNSLNPNDENADMYDGGWSEADKSGTAHISLNRLLSLIFYNDHEKIPGTDMSLSEMYTMWVCFYKSEDEFDRMFDEEYA